MGSVTQLNVRLNSDVKAAGDSVLDLYGISSTQVIRSLWEKLAHGEEALRQFVDMLAAPPAAGTVVRPTTDAEAEDVNDSFLKKYQEFTRKVELDPSTYEPLSDEELDDLVYQDYLEDYERKAMRYEGKSSHTPA